MSPSPAGELSGLDGPALSHTWLEPICKALAAKAVVLIDPQNRAGEVVWLF